MHIKKILEIAIPTASAMVRMETASKPLIEKSFNASCKIFSFVSPLFLPIKHSSYTNIDAIFFPALQK